MYHMSKRDCNLFCDIFQGKTFTRLIIIESLSFIIILDIVQWDK